ncbi:rhodanese domain-containing protein CG4456 isoform X1 [Helicoverpa armigera]|uniref:rhodanese domain-containing protein CG4456 isoform X1 n=2 Tax=Helicoverpa armigera TaxID=29058 RepID=UPI00308317CC
MFSFPTSLTAARNAVRKTNIHSLYSFIVGRRESTNGETDFIKMVDPKRVLKYEDMLQVIHQPEKVIIDVRDPDEVQSTGKIPSSINIPLGDVHESLVTMSHEDFRRQYQREKPSNSDELIFYCQSGRRSSEALHKALQMGYVNSKTYLGSWSDWSSRHSDNNV